MEEKLPEHYNIEDFVTDESFFNYHFKLKKSDELFWNNWIEHHAAQVNSVNEAKKLLNDLSLTLPENEYKVEFEKIKSALYSNAEPSVFRYPELGEQKNKRRRKVRYLMPLLLVLIVGGGLFWFFHNDQPIQPKQLAAIANNGNVAMEFTLSDGSTIMLQPKSSLDYPAVFSKESRDVYLHGDAQFYVKHNAAQPFKVHVENITATDLGTVFNIKESADSAIVVELLKGSLNVELNNSTTGTSIVLHPSERAVYMKLDKRLYGDKLNNHLLFNKNSFEEIAAQIQYNFGIKVINNNDKKDWRFTGEFKNTTAENIVENICFIKGLKYSVVDENTIVIK